MIPLFFTPPSSGEVCSAGSSHTIAPVDWWFLARRRRRRRPALAHVEIFAKFSKKDIRWKNLLPTQSPIVYLRDEYPPSFED